MTDLKKKGIRPAAIFLIIIAVLVILVIIGGVWLTAAPISALRIAFTPSHDIATEVVRPSPDYTDTANWLMRPGMDTKANWVPDGSAPATTNGVADVFYIHPTTAFSKDKWNADLHGTVIDRRNDQMVLKYQASAFNESANVYAPRYHQATFGTFFSSEANVLEVAGRAFGDVLKAFDDYIANDNNGRPFIIAGHSQGALLTYALLKERIADTKLQDQLVAAYAIGWPFSVEADLPALAPLTACTTATDTGCIISYQSFEAGGDPSMVFKLFNNSTGLTGKTRLGTNILCTNPQSWTIGGAATADSHQGLLSLDLNDKALPAPTVGSTASKCGKDGILYLDTPPRGISWSAFQMTGANMHAYDYNLFYMNIRSNATTRINAWMEGHTQ